MAPKMKHKQSRVLECGKMAEGARNNISEIIGKVSKTTVIFFCILFCDAKPTKLNKDSSEHCVIFL